MAGPKMKEGKLAKELTFRLIPVDGGFRLILICRKHQKTFTPRQTFATEEIAMECARLFIKEFPKWETEKQKPIR